MFLWKDYIPLRWGKEFNLLKVRLFYRKNKVYIGSYEVERGAKLGKHVRVLHDVQIRKSATIGDYTYVEPYTTIISAQIGKYCSVGKCCQIGAWEHPIQNITTSPEILRKIVKRGDLYNDLPAPSIIGNDVWIGSNAVIKGGVQVGNGAIVAAGAVVTKNIPPYAIVAGVPAKIIRYRFEEDVVNKLLDLKWWDWSVEDIIKKKKLFIGAINLEELACHGERE